jgi:hypothetical protein
MTEAAKPERIKPAIEKISEVAASRKKSGTRSAIPRN